MENYPDNIGDHTCPSCKEIIPNCICQEVDLDQLFKEALHGGDEDTYYGMFDSIDSDEAVMLIRKLHQNPSEETTKLLIEQLDMMLTKHIENIN